MSTTICLDFGNTRLKSALFINDQLTEVIHLRENVTEHLLQIIKYAQPQFSILSSVINHSSEIETLLAANTDFHKLSNLSKLPFTVPVGKPETVGADRLAIAAAAVHYYPNKNNLMIALGSCITYNFINSLNQLIGGSISPGIEIRFKSLNDYTAKLPLVKSDWNVPLIGYDTITNIQSGVVLGMAKEIDGIVDSYEERFGNFNAVLTGGDLLFIAPHLKRKIFSDPELLFKGLYAISRYNHA